MWYIMLIDVGVLNPILASRHLAMVYDSFNVLLNSVG